MVVATTFSRAQVGINAPMVTVEADVTQGLPQIVIVGLPETAVKESKDRVKAAITNSGFSLPSRRVTINLAPADLPKQGGRYDLAIALSLLAASQQIDHAWIAQAEFLGELSLGGELRAVSGALPAVIKAGEDGRKLFIPCGNEQEASLVEGVDVSLCQSLKQVIAVIKGAEQPNRPIKLETYPQNSALSLGDVKGQHLAKRALTIAAAGSHNLLMVGPPGTGKTMLARRIIDLMPAMTRQASQAIAAIQSVSNFGARQHEWGARPFRNPHHTASAVAMVGGGNPPLPGEISLAHEGILFLDELPEFSRHVLEVLREPIESGEITISRAQHQVTYPSRFLLISAMNPCPCGFYGDGTDRCDCSLDRIVKYLGKVSGPLLDRIDLHVKVPALERGALTSGLKEAPFDQNGLVRKIATTRESMLARAGKPNAHLSSQDVKEHCRISDDDQVLMEDVMQQLDLSVRGYFKTLKIARTIADLSGCSSIETQHLTEALAFRDTTFLKRAT